MSVLQGVLLEEIQRLENNISHYEEMLESLPRGSIYIRKMGNSSFAYRKRKENGKVISIYLGNSSGNNIEKEIEVANEYKRVKANLRIAKIELKKLRKAYKAYE